MNEEEDYWEHLEDFETLYELCCYYCEEALAKRLGYTDGRGLKLKDYGKALKILEDNWEEIENEICKEHWEEENKRFPWGIVDEDDFRLEVVDGMEKCQNELKGRWNNYCDYSMNDKK